MSTGDRSTEEEAVCLKVELKSMEKEVAAQLNKMDVVVEDMPELYILQEAGRL